MLTVIPVNEGLDYIERARESFTKILSFDKDKSLSLLNLALALDCQARHACTQEEGIKILQEAIGYLEQARAIDPQNYKIFSNLGELYVRLVEVSPTNYEQRHKFLELAIQAFSEGIALYRTFSLLTRKANTLLMLGRIEQDNKTQEDIFQTAKATYNDAYIIAPRRVDAAIACLKIAYILSVERNSLSLPQDRRDSFIFEGLQRYMLALEHAPFYDDLQYEIAKLILNIAKFGDQDIPLLKKMMQPQVQVVTQKQKGHGRGRFNHAPKQVHQAADHAMLSVKTNLLDASYRYFRDAAYLMPENSQVFATRGEASVYWAFLQKKLNNQEKADKELELAAQALDKADSLQPHSASYVRACLHAVKGETELCKDRLKEVAQNDICPPRSQVAREPYFSGYAKDQWFKDTLKTIPDRPVGDLYSTTIFSDSGASA